MIKRAGGLRSGDLEYASAFAQIDADTAAEFRKECEALQMIRHPNLIIFYGAGTSDDGRFFLVTELLAGGPLRKALLDTEKEIDWDVRTRVATQIAQGMQHLHSLSIVHRDLKVYCMAIHDLSLPDHIIRSNELLATFRRPLYRVCLSKQQV